MKFVISLLIYSCVSLYFMCALKAQTPITIHNKEVYFPFHNNLSTINIFKPSGANHVKAPIEKQLHFNYGNETFGPSNWHRNFPRCSGNKQSPIDITLSKLFEVRFPPLSYSNTYNSLPFVMEIMNNKHSVQLTAHFENVIPTITGGPLKGNYAFEEMHFHWGTSDNQGSEHSVNGEFFPMEMHLLHRRQDKKLNHTNKFAVLAFFFNVSKQANKFLDPIIESLDTIGHEPLIRHSLNHTFALSDIIEPFKSQYVTYSGSITSPPCGETVTWLISSHPLLISKNQIKSFRKLLVTEPEMMDNHRPIQNLGTRTIFYAI